MENTSMEEMRHFNAFCELFQRLDTLCKNGLKGSDEAKKIIGVMQFHFRNLNDKMYKYLDKFTPRLLEMGYSFNVDAPGVPVSDIDNSDQVKISGKFEYASMVDERTQVERDGQKVGAIFNYNEFSKSIVDLRSDEFEQIKKKTIENIKFEMACLENPELKNKLLAKHRQPRKWSLADSEKDW